MENFKSYKKGQRMSIVKSVRLEDGLYTKEIIYALFEEATYINNDSDYWSCLSIRQILDLESYLKNDSNFEFIDRTLNRGSVTGVNFSTPFAHV